MRVELHIYGQLYRQWEFDAADYHEPLCEVSFEEKKELWLRIIAKCEEEVDPTILQSVPHHFFWIVPARTQAADIKAEEYEQFLNHIIENKNSII